MTGGLIQLVSRGILDVMLTDTPEITYFKTVYRRYTIYAIETFEEIFYSFEEGSRLFPERSSWQNPNSYPALKIDIEKERKPCIFYNSTLRSCSIYDIRPQICRKYYCQFLFDVLHPVDKK